MAVTVDGHRRSSPTQIYAYTNPLPPTNLSTTSINPTSFKLAWRSAGPEDFVLIQIFDQNRNSKNPMSEQQKISNEPSQQIFKGLKPATLYRVTLFSSYQGKFSTPVHRQISTDPYVAEPKPPVNLIFSDISSKSKGLKQMIHKHIRRILNSVGKSHLEYEF